MSHRGMVRNHVDSRERAENWPWLSRNTWLERDGLKNGESEETTFASTETTAANRVRDDGAPSPNWHGPCLPGYLCDYARCALQSALELWRPTRSLQSLSNFSGVSPPANNSSVPQQFGQSRSQNTFWPRATNNTPVSGSPTMATADFDRYFNHLAPHVQHVQHSLGGLAFGRGLNPAFGTRTNTPELSRERDDLSPERWRTLTTKEFLGPRSYDDDSVYDGDSDDDESVSKSLRGTRQCGKPLIPSQDLTSYQAPTSSPTLSLPYQSRTDYRTPTHSWGPLSISLSLFQAPTSSLVPPFVLLSDPQPMISRNRVLDGTGFRSEMTQPASDNEDTESIASSVTLQHEISDGEGSEEEYTSTCTGDSNKDEEDEDLVVDDTDSVGSVSPLYDPSTNTYTFSHRSEELRGEKRKAVDSGDEIVVRKRVLDKMGLAAILRDSGRDNVDDGNVEEDAGNGDGDGDGRKKIMENEEIGNSLESKLKEVTK